MKLNQPGGLFVRKLLVVLMLLTFPGFAWGQKNKAPSAPSAPKAAPAAPKAAPKAPAASGGAHTNAAGGTHSNTATGAHTNTATGAHTNTATGAHTNTATGAHTNTATGAHTNTATTNTAHAGTVTHPGGGKTVTTASGNTRNVSASGKTTSLTTKSGATAKMGSNGKVTSIHSGNTTINHGAGGQRRVETRRADGSRVVSNGRHGGYVEHGFNRGGRSYNRRTYYRGGHAYTHVYGRGYYHGRYYNHYYPGSYYGRGYYGWAYGGWGAPVAFSWGWGGNPWYGYYGYYFNPYPVYAAPAFWITDYLIAANLQAAYAVAAENANAAAANANAAAANANAAAEGGDGGGQQQVAQQGQGSGGGGAGAVILTPEVKAAIAEEVKAQIKAEQDAAAASGPQAPAAAPASTAQNSDPDAPPPAGTPEVVPDALNPNNRTFIVSDTLNPQLADGTECSLTQGDVLTRIDDTADADQNVKVLVSGSQKGDCHSGQQLSVSVDSLQEMHNHFREQIDDGLGELAKKQGTGGLPAAPAGSTTAKANPEGQASPDLTAQADLEKQNQQADSTEKEVQVAANEGVGS
jgi:hypothetical protein